jgi:hypothetical protein
MTWYEEMTWCDGCGVEITWAPVVVEGRTYCCRDCSQGLLCICGERMELDEEQRGSTPVNTTYMI